MMKGIAGPLVALFVLAAGYLSGNSDHTGNAPTVPWEPEGVIKAGHIYVTLEGDG
ncbi:hypothetical protein [Thermococcus siculi]|uniref:hypothetical protein n=1 Tax=Thermococcus siculi TaxID=72803 RepID=UPI0012FE109E|nr:hypothetical protein [Thermococcus siculi]